MDPVENWLACARYDLRTASAMLDFIGEINNASIPTRYPDDLKQMTREYNRKRVDNYLTQARRTIRWLSRQARSER